MLAAPHASSLSLSPLPGGYEHARRCTRTLTVLRRTEEDSDSRNRWRYALALCRGAGNSHIHAMCHASRGERRGWAPRHLCSITHAHARRARRMKWAKADGRHRRNEWRRQQKKNARGAPLPLPALPTSCLPFCAAPCMSVALLKKKHEQQGRRRGKEGGREEEASTAVAARQDSEAEEEMRALRIAAERHNKAFHMRRITPLAR